MLKLHIPCKIFYRNRVLRCLLFLRLLQKLKHTLRSCRRGLKKVYHLSDLLDRLSKVPDVLEEGLNISNLNASFNGKDPSQESHHYISQVSHKLHNRHHHS